VRCPFCEHQDTKVVDARNQREAPVKWRRRECGECGRRFTTYERIEDLLPEVIKRDGRREPYSRPKLLSGLQRACEKRPVTSGQIEAILAKVERALLDVGEREVASERIGAEIRESLRELDFVAWLRFSSVYLDFGSIEEIRAALDEYEARCEVDSPGDG